MVSHIKLFSNNMQGRQSSSGFCLYNGKPAMVKMSKYCDLSCELDINITNILWNRNKIHFCKPIASMVMLKGNTLIVLERLIGKPMQNFLNKRTINSIEISQYIACVHQTLATITMLHLAEIAHADLHTRNLMVCPTPHNYFVYLLGGREVICIETMNNRVVMIDFGMSTMPGKDTTCDDQLIFAGLTPNGSADTAADIRVFFMAICYDILSTIHYCTDEDDINTTSRLKIYHLMAAVLNMLAGLPNPSSEGWFGGKFPNADDALIASIPQSIRKKIPEIVLVQIGHLCKTMIPRPYKYISYSEEEQKHIWVNFLQAINLQLPSKRPLTEEHIKKIQFYVKLVVTGKENPSEQILKSLLNLGLMTSSYIAKCYERIYQVKEDMMKHIRWRNGLDVWARLPVIPFQKAPRIGENVMIQDLVNHTCIEGPMTDSMFENMMNTRRILMEAQKEENLIFNYREPLYSVYSTKFSERKPLLELQIKAGLAFAKCISLENMDGMLTAKAKKVLENATIL